jgi:uncharacterized protein (DUF2236 family)
MAHDYKRNGTTTRQEFIRFLNVVENQVPANKQVHVVLDNYATHKHPKVIEWLGRHKRFTFHFSFLDQRRRELLRQAHQTKAETRRVPLYRCLANRHKPLRQRRKSVSWPPKTGQVAKRESRP